MTNLLLKAPFGYAAILREFGDPTPFLQADGTPTSGWERKILVPIDLPTPLPLSWDLSKRAHICRVHYKTAPFFKRAFALLEENGGLSHLTDYGGTYEWRRKRTSSQLSVHSWGIAIDLNTITNKLGEDGDMHPLVVQAFKDAGFCWGGDFSGTKDPQHFQLCFGY